ncbi:MAG TPA: fumarylacetoacetate hydrolase family protein [Steroidobacteraceae bacterium]|jgi:2-keto-4-pentenoate hydratase/2-oxohepta-3-ene-1,7-dioic acid hydratase in catechol pathway
MALNVIRFQHDQRAQWGVIRQGRITPVPGHFSSTADFLRGTSFAALAALDAPQLAESAVRLLSPITRDRQFVCQGANYRQHMIESGMDPDAKSFNMIFTKASSCIVAADSEVVRPSFVKFLDYEIELGLVLRTDLTAATRVTDESLHETIAGLVIVNDYSARDVQIPQSQFYKGKSYRTFGPVGPYLCLLEPQDFAYLRKLQLTLTVNGEVRQNDDTGNLVHRPAATLTELSGVQDLFAGDLIATGTPAGCALSIPPPSKQRIAALLSARKRWDLFMKAQSRRPQYLQPGDVVEARIRSADGAIDLGVQRNRVVSAAA